MLYLHEMGKILAGCKVKLSRMYKHLAPHLTHEPTSLAQPLTSACCPYMQPLLYIIYIWLKTVRMQGGCRRGSCCRAAMRCATRWRTCAASCRPTLCSRSWSAPGPSSAPAWAMWPTWTISSVSPPQSPSPGLIVCGKQCCIHVRLPSLAGSLSAGGKCRSTSLYTRSRVLAEGSLCLPGRKAGRPLGDEVGYTHAVACLFG